MTEKESRNCFQHIMQLSIFDQQKTKSMKSHKTFEDIRSLYGIRFAWLAFIAGHILTGVFAALALVGLLYLAAFVKHQII